MKCACDKTENIQCLPYALHLVTFRSVEFFLIFCLLLRYDVDTLSLAKSDAKVKVMWPSH